MYTNNKNRNVYFSDLKECRAKFIYSALIKLALHIDINAPLRFNNKNKKKKKFEVKWK